MKKNRLILLIFPLLLLGCTDVFEEDISSETVDIIYPKSNEIIYSNVVNFQWEPVVEASAYQLQVYDENSLNVLDTLVSNTNFSQSLAPGLYEWKVRAENFAYSTSYTSLTAFEVAVTTDLSQQVVILNTPSDQKYFSDISNLSLTWSELPAATSYELFIDKDLNGIQTIVSAGNLTQTIYTPDVSLFSDDAIYKWRIAAHNSVSATAFAERIFYIDKVVPNQPQLLLPDDAANISTTSITFTWQTGNDSGNVQSPIIHYIYIATDIDFSQVIAQASTNTNQLVYSITSSGTYYWRVKSIDEAGNSSTSITRTFTIQ